MENTRVIKTAENTYVIDDKYTFRVETGEQILAYRSVKGVDHLDVLNDLEILTSTGDVESQLLTIVDAYTE